MDAKRPVRRQILSSVCGNLLTVASGSSSSWSSANFLEFQKPDSLLPSGPLTLRESTLVMSLYFVGAIIGNLTFPHIVKRSGSKKAMIAVGFSQIINWLLTIYAQNPYYLFITSITDGIFEAGQFICITLFVSEISHDSIRGSLNAIMDPAYNIGMLLGFVIANYFNYVDQAKFHLILPAVFLVIFSQIPESPQHLINTQRHKAANKAHKFFKGTELEKLPVNEAKAIQENSELSFSDFTNCRARKAMAIAFSLVLLNSLQGFAIILTYVTEIFASTNPNISAINASMVITSILIGANFIYMNLVDRAGRRVFYICSSIAAFVGHVLFALYLYFLTDNHAFDWVPIVCLSYVLFVSSLGMNPVPFLVSIEIFPKKIRQYGYSNCILLALVDGFILTELYPLLKEYIGLFGWVTFFAAMCLCNALFGIFILPETRGKSHEEIMKMLDE